MTRISVGIDVAALTRRQLLMGTAAAGVVAG